MILTIKKYRNKELNIAGVLTTRYKNTLIHKRNLEILDDIAKQCNTKLYEPIRECTALQETRSMKESIYQYAPHSHASEDYMKLVKEIID